MEDMLLLVESQVQIGVPLPWSIRNDRGMLLLKRGYVIHSEEQLRLVLERGAYVDAEEERLARLAGASAGTANEPPRRPHGLFDEWADACHRLKGLLRNPAHKPDFPQHIARLADDVVALIGRDADVSIYTIVRQENVQFFDFGYVHSVHAAVAGTLMAQHLGWPAERVLLLVKAALTMNISIADVQGRIATQDMPLLESQKATIRAHTDRSVAILGQCGVADPDWLTAVAQHHEHPDGSGYPLGLTDIAPLGLLLRHADTFTAKISPRASRPAMTTRQAAGQLFQEDKGGPMSTALIREFGIYPPGDFVKLKSGECAVVMRRSDNARAPLVASVIDMAGTLTPRSVRRDTADPAFAIVSGVTDKKHVGLMARMPPQRFYGISA